MKHYALILTMMGTLTSACASESDSTGPVLSGTAPGTAGGPTGPSSSGGPAAAPGDPAQVPGSTGATPVAGATGGGAAPPTGTPVDGGGSAAPTANDPATPGNDSAHATACLDTDTCTYGSQTCCVYEPGNAMCIDGSDCPMGGPLGLIAGSPTTCDGPEDCSVGEICCVTVNTDGARTSCETKINCDHLSGLIGVWQLCHTDEHCGGNLLCEPVDQFPFWGYCN